MLECDTSRALTVDVIDQYGGNAPPHTIHIMISSRCSECGKPRGQIKRSKLSLNGQVIDYDHWDNPCGHKDWTDQLITESFWMKYASQLNEFWYMYGDWLEWKDDPEVLRAYNRFHCRIMEQLVTSLASI